MEVSAVSTNFLEIRLDPGLVPIEPARKVVSSVLHGLYPKDSVGPASPCAQGVHKLTLMALGIKGLKPLSQSRIFN